MDRQIVIIAPDGVISSLRRKDGLDLRQFGNVEIQRVSDIKWCISKQKWYVEIIAGPLKGTVVHPLFYKEYEDAVEAETIFLDGLRKRGKF